MMGSLVYFEVVTCRGAIETTKARTKEEAIEEISKDRYDSNVCCFCSKAKHDCIIGVTKIIVSWSHVEINKIITVSGTIYGLDARGCLYRFSHGWGDSTFIKSRKPLWVKVNNAQALDEITREEV